MRDQYRKLMFESFKDAMELVHDFNEWTDEAYDNGVPVPPQAVPQVAMMLYQTRVANTLDGGTIDIPDFDDRMYE